MCVSVWQPQHACAALPSPLLRRAAHPFTPAAAHQRRQDSQRRTCSRVLTVQSRCLPSRPACTCRSVLPLFIICCPAPPLYVPFSCLCTSLSPASVRPFLLQASQFEAEYQAVMREAEEASGRDKSVLEAKAGKVKAKLDDALTKVSAIEVAPLPKVEVSEGVKTVTV